MMKIKLIIIGILIFSIAAMTAFSKPKMSTEALNEMRDLGFYNHKLYTPFYGTEWNEIIKGMPTPTAYWPMKDGAGTTITDIAGGNDLTLSNAAGWVQVGDRLIGSDLAANGGFETAGGGGADIWANWTEAASDGALANETVIIHGGADAAKITAGASLDTRITQNITVVAGTTLKYSFWTRGDGTHEGKYSFYDVTNTADIIALTGTGVTGTTYTEVTSTLTVPTGCTTIRIIFRCPSTDTGIAYFDDFTFQRYLADAVPTLPLGPPWMIETTPIATYYNTTYYASITGAPVGAAGALNTDGATAGTWMGWVYPRDDGEGNWGRIIEKSNGLVINTTTIDEINFVLYDSGGADSSETTSSPLLVMNKWYFIACVYDGSVPNSKIYVGDLTGTLTLEKTAVTIEATLTDAGNDLYIGDRSINDRATNGYLGPVAIYNGTALNVNQIHAWQRLTGGIIQGIAARQ